jgi:ESAT-6 family protein
MTAGDDGLYVNYLGVSNVGDALQDATQQIETMYTDLMNDVRPLQASWSGSAMQAWQALQTKWNSDIAAMQQVMVQYRSTLDEMSIHYSNTDNQLANSWQGIS